jgi:hypothetical protein
MTSRSRLLGPTRLFLAWRCWVGSARYPFMHRQPLLPIFFHVLSFRLWLYRYV